jgi:pseudaminic acid biosynthesis-associated methylase
MNYKTEQENFWATNFGDNYQDRNDGEELISSNIALFCKILKSCPDVNSITELGCNIGLNLSALKRINTRYQLRGYEINSRAATTASNLKIAEIINTTITEPLNSIKKFDLTFTKLVLIHINPLELEVVYRNLYEISNKYIMVCEYYNPIPTSIEYRGNKDKLFKRDFAGEMIDKYNLKLVDYGFNYYKDKHLTNDDATWFLLSKY